MEFSLTGKGIDFLGWRTLRHLLSAMGKSSFGSHDTPHLATAVWLGHARSRIEMPGITGGTIPAKVWGRYMKVARGTYCGDFKDPAAPFQARPFFGDYSSSGGTRDDLGTDPADPDAFGGTAPEDAGGQGDGGTGENGFGTPGTDDDGEADDSDSGRRFPPAGPSATT